MTGSVYFTTGQGQLFAFLAHLSRVEPSQIQTNPFAADQLQGDILQGVSPDTTASLNISHLAASAYLSRLGGLEAELIKTLAVEPDALIQHENRDGTLEEFFATQQLAWQRLTGYAPLATTDLIALRRARQTAERRVNKWARVYTGQLEQPSIDVATEQLNQALSALSLAWLYRVDLAKFSYSYVSTDPLKSLAAFFDAGVRIERRVKVLEEIETSLRLFSSGNDR